MIAFNELKKNLKKSYAGFRKIRIAILADSASQLLHTAIRGWGYEAGIDFEVYEADYNQVDLQVFDPNSGLYAFQPEFIFINRSTEKLLSEFYHTGRHAQALFSDQVVHRTSQYFAAISSRLRSKVIINTYPEIDDRVFGNYASKVSTSFLYQLRKVNLSLMELSQQTGDLFICDLAALQSSHGAAMVFDPKMYVNADMVYSLEFLPMIARQIADIILAVTGTFRKCLILDLDNTTWGGIIGDDGMGGIQIGHLGLGKVYTEMQQWAHQLRHRGIILCICSKNTEEIAMEPFLNHPDMVLRMDDIAVFVANWETKVDNIRYIQSVLNIGFDSMVFIDDNPFEREMVKSGIPGITVPDLPEDPAEYLIYLRSLNLFETASFTQEDEERTRQYREEAQRTVLMQSFENENDFLAGLEMVSEAKAFDDFSIPRVAQLTQRSNQFNLRTVRYTEDDIRAICHDPKYLTLSLTLEDRFGDHGLIGVIILHRKDDETMFVDTWIMSCRVLKRGMENYTLNKVAEIAALHHFKRIEGEYLPTKKNGIVKEHYAHLGFSPMGDNWVLDIENYEKRPTFIFDKQLRHGR